MNLETDLKPYFQGVTKAPCLGIVLFEAQFGEPLLDILKSSFAPSPSPIFFETTCACIQARKRHININFFVRLVLGRPRVCPGDFTGFVPGTNPVKTWDKPGFSPYFHRICPWDKPGLSQKQSRGRRASQKVYVKKVYVPFRSLCMCWHSSGHNRHKSTRPEPARTRKVKTIT